MSLNLDNFKTLNFKQIAKEGPQPVDFIWDGFLAGSVGALVSPSPGGVGKSYFALEAAVAVAGGCDLLDLGPRRTGRVVYFDAQNRKEILIYRLHAISKYLSQEEWETVAKNLVVEPVYGSSLNIMRKDHLKKVIEVGSGSRLIILDPISRMHQLDEDKSSDVARLADRLGYIADKTGAALLFLCNVAGDSMLVDRAARWCGFLRVMKEKEAMVLSDYSLDQEAIGQKRRHLYVYFDTVNDYDVPSTSRWFVRDENGVLRPVAIGPATLNGEMR